MKKRLWTQEELMLALNLYLKLPFGKMDHRTLEVQELANLIGRTPGAVSMRLGNFAAVDPYHINRGIKGLQGGISIVKPIWDDYIMNREDFIFMSEILLAEKQGINIENKYDYNSHQIDFTKLEGKEKINDVKVRINQNVFRQIVLANYSSRCVVSNINHPELLIASHIVPWSHNQEERLNPENGLCLSGLHDKAFDKGLISIDLDYKMVISKQLKEYSKNEYFQYYFGQFEHKPIEKAGKYNPKKEFLEYHLVNIFKG